MTTEKEHDPMPEIVQKYAGKTIRVSTEFQSRIYKISIEYVEDTMLEVDLIPLADDGSIASSTFDLQNKDQIELSNYEDVYLKAVRKAKAIARTIEKELDTDFDDEDV